MVIRWSEDARDDLREVVAYIAQDDPEAARNLATRIRQALGKASRFPRMGRVVPEFDDEMLREMIVAPYRLVYRLRADQELLVVRVWHYRRILPDDSIRG